ncbi:MAG: hypothetical protein EXR62_06035 [Chloroflexi bacterium]|nr:hypothetical protein [Chloroflexota bacterium]
MPNTEKMTIEERRKYLKLMSKRYQRAQRAEQSHLLDEMETITGLHRKSLLRLLQPGGLERQSRRKQRGRSYDHKEMPVSVTLSFDLIGVLRPYRDRGDCTNNRLGLFYHGAEIKLTKERMGMKIRHVVRKPWLRLALALAALLMVGGLGPAAPVQAHTGTFKIAMIRVTYADTSPLYTLAQLNQAAAEIQAYYGKLSYGQLDLQVSMLDVTTSQPKSFYYDACKPAGQEARNPCPPLLVDDSAQAAAAAGFNFSGIDGIVILGTFCGDDVTVGPVKISRPGVNGTFQRAFDYECSGSGMGLSGVRWAAWVHEFGHMLQLSDYGESIFSIGGGGHPSGYASGYELMDSCYPCHESSFGLSGPPVENGSFHVFSGWLPSAKVATFSTPNSGTTIVLAPLEINPADTPAPQAIQLPVAPGIYYMVEVRRRLFTDNITNTATSEMGIWDQGVRILEVEESRNPPVKQINACDTTVIGGCASGNDVRMVNCANDAYNHRDYCWPYALWHVGQSFTDAQNGIKITVSATVGEGFAVTVSRGVPLSHPDLYIVPWLTPPLNTYETIDIWLDSSCNGYESDVGISGLRYGRDQDGNAIGNGDDPCANHENRIYARIRNIGDAPASNVLVYFEISDPVGVGMSDNWTVVGSIPVPYLAQGASTVIYANWTPVVSLSPQQIADGHFKFHTCVQIEIHTLPNEWLIDNNVATENFDNFEAVKDSISGIYQPIHGEFHIKNTPLNGQAPDFRTYELWVQSDLPVSWAYAVANGQPAITLALGDTGQIPVDIQVPPDEPIGQSYLLKALALTQVYLLNPAIPLTWPIHSHRTTISAGGVVLAARTVLATSLSLAANRDGIGNIAAAGGLAPAHQTLIAVDYTDPLGTIFTRLPGTDAGGNYLSHFAPWRSGIWTVRSLWQGDLDHASAVSDPVLVTVEGMTTCQSDLSGDRVVDSADLSLLVNRWRQALGQPYATDNNGKINIVDVAQVAAQIGRPCG